MRLALPSQQFFCRRAVAIKFVKLVKRAEQRLSDFLRCHIRYRVAECVGERGLSLSRLIHGYFDIMDMLDSSCDLV